MNAHQDFPPDILARVNAADVVFFLGAGCSIEPPAGLPSATELANQLIANGFGTAGDTLEQVAEECQRRGPNVLSEALPKADWRAKPCNLAHRVLAQLAKEGLINQIVTTNWDTLVEHGLRMAGVPFTPVVDPLLLREGGLAGGVRVVKIHGCIDHTEPPLRATKKDLAEWADEWARVLFEYVALTRTLCFVGYSGAAASVTVTLAAVVGTPQRESNDYVVDPRGRDSVAGTEEGDAFIAALGDDPSRFLSMTSSVFFDSLRIAIFPLLLERPWQALTRQLGRLCAPTQVPPQELLEAAAEIRTAWEAQGPDAAQENLTAMLAGAVQTEVDHPYTPVIPNSDLLASVWFALALLMWSQSALLLDDVFRSTKGVQEGWCFLAIAAGIERRDVAGINGVREYVETHRGVGLSLLVVVFGDMGPMPEEQTVNASVVRTDAKPTSVRPSGPRCVWIPGARLSSLFTKDVTSDALKAELHKILVERLSTP